MWGHSSFRKLQSLDRKFIRGLFYYAIEFSTSVFGFSVTLPLLKNSWKLWQWHGTVSMHTHMTIQASGDIIKQSGIISSCIWIHPNCQIQFLLHCRWSEGDLNEGGFQQQSNRLLVAQTREQSRPKSLLCFEHSVYLAGKVGCKSSK